MLSHLEVTNFSFPLTKYISISYTFKKNSELLQVFISSEN